ncbi:hypothetical protein BT93_L2656 [Corymbia citriodora subsp. variegata]|uniref:Uncharacterized protein n=1 Tax=Corymbia citriodora subsp. variegata TaxID=360336 RepID=A0A8T0CW48_CORYI|nr:hypothetical protein BT93_L2656 [Corymbia citriodora subsp. variegata]
MCAFSILMYRYIENFEPPVLPGGDMPEGFVLVEGSTISFMVSQGFYDKFQGLALCVVFDVEDGGKDIFLDIVPHINGQQRNGLSGSLGSFDSDSMWIQYLKPNILWGVLHGAVDFLEFDEEYLQFSLTIKLSGGSVEKLGYVLRCMQMDDNLKAVLKDNQLIDPASIYELEWSDFECKFLKEAVLKDNQLIDPASIYELEWSDFERKFLEEVGCQMEEVEAGDNSEEDKNDNSDSEID